MKRIIASLNAVVVLLTILAFGSEDCYASGFAIFNQDALTWGEGDAAIAHTDGPSSIFFNPALLTELDGTQVSIGTTLIIPTNKFTSDSTGNEFKADSRVFFPSTLYLSNKFNEKVSAGLGVFSPFGLGLRWGDTWEGRFIVTDVELRTYDVRPVAAYQITPDISVSAGLDVLRADAKLENKIPSQLGDIDQKFTGDGTGYGYNFGVLFKPVKDVGIGASYRSRVKVKLDGKVEFDNPAIPGSNGNAEIKFPQQALFGISYKGIENLVVEASVRWEGWHSFNELRIDLDQPISGNSSVVYPKDWKNTYAYDIGGQYRLNRTVTLLAGYLYGSTPVPDSTFDPTIPDSITNTVTAGIGLDYDRSNFAFSYGYLHYANRFKENNVPEAIPLPVAKANGKYTGFGHLVCLSFTHKF
jgi:long-chain fatty acid transport protein